MRKVTLFLLLFLCFSVLTANAESPVRYGVIGGLNLSFNSTDAAESIAGFHVGGKVEYSFTNRLYLEGGLLFSRKGHDFNALYYTDDAGNHNAVKMTTKNHYLELPIHLGFKFNINRGVSFFLSAGGYLGVGLFGKFKYKSPDENYSVNLYTGDSEYRRFDCGVGFRGGVELYKRIQLSVSYDWGLINIVKDASDYKNRNAMFSCAYMF